MSDLGFVHKFAKWVQIRKELKYDKALEVIEKFSGTYDITERIRQLQKDFNESANQLYIVSNVFFIIVFGLSVLSALLTTLGFIS